MKEIIKKKFEQSAQSAGTSIKWVIFALITGLVVGCISTGFHFSIMIATMVREATPWVIFLLPIGGLIIDKLNRLPQLHDRIVLEDGTILEVHQLLKNRIEEIRKARNIRQEEFAKEMGVSRQTISSLENGRYNPSILLAYKIAKYFELSIEEVFIFEEETA